MKAWVTYWTGACGKTPSCRFGSRNLWVILTEYVSAAAFERLMTIAFCTACKTIGGRSSGKRNGIRKKQGRERKTNNSCMTCISIKH